MLKQWIDLEKTNGTALIWDSAVPSNIGQKASVPLLQQLWSGQTTAEQVQKTPQTNLEKLQSGKVKVPGM